MQYKVQSGNELIVQGALEAGFKLLTGYPGSPVADYFNILYQKKSELKQYGIKVVIGNSESHAAAMASGAKMVGEPCLVVMKSMGLHVASDALSVGNFAFAKARSATVIVVGDDPWSISTSTPADSRYLFKHLHIPFLMPTNPKELKDWVAQAKKLSEQSGIYVGILLTTNMAEGGGGVFTQDYKKIYPAIAGDGKILEPSSFDLPTQVMVPPNSIAADENMLKNRFPLLQKYIEELDLDEVYGNPKSKIGVIAIGNLFQTLKQFLQDQNLLDQVQLFKLACPYPLTGQKLDKFLSKIEHLIVVEEKRDFLESSLRAYVHQRKSKVQIWGKVFDDGIEGFPSHGGVEYEQIQNAFQKLTAYIPKLAFSSADCAFKDKIEVKNNLKVPTRLPTFCPGCPHRETLSLLKELRRDLGEKDVQFISHGDVGCYSLSFLPPFKEMHDLSAMGQGGALASGADIFLKNPSVVLMGDSTFFHSGMTVISNSVQLGHNITYILLDNDNTAMTGHQMTPVSGVSVDGVGRPRQDMHKIVSGMGITSLIQVNPSDRYFYKNTLKDWIKRPGTKVIISDKECALTFGAKKRSLERKEIEANGFKASQVFYQINLSSCEDCRECVELTGCPGLTQAHDAYGTKVQIDPQICVNDSYCTKIKACPSFEKVELKNYLQISTDLKIADEFQQHDLVWPKELRIVVAGVGGSGIKTVSSVLAKSLGQSFQSEDLAIPQDLNFQFFDQKGLAQRNGTVISHLSFFEAERSLSMITPKHHANLLIALDLLEGFKNTHFMSSKGMAVIDYHMQRPITYLLEKDLDQFFTDQQMRDQLKSSSFECFIFPFKKFCFEKLGRNVYASMMVLGFLYQGQRLPFAYSDLSLGSKKALPHHDWEKNWQAFQFGQSLASEGIDPFCKRFEFSFDAMEEKSSELLPIYLQGIHQAQWPFLRDPSIQMQYSHGLKQLENIFPELSKNHLMTYLYDQFIFDLGQKHKEFLNGSKEISQKFKGLKEKSIALRIFAKTYFIKDEVWVAHNLSSSLKKNLDRKRYAASSRSYKIRHINRPEFVIGSIKIAFDFSPKVWMLKIMSWMRFLRLMLPSWHKKEKEISQHIRKMLFSEEVHQLDVEKQIEVLKTLDSVKGYRSVRFKAYFQAITLLKERGLKCLE